MSKYPKSEERGQATREAPYLLGYLVSAVAGFLLSGDRGRLASALEYVKSSGAK